MARHPRGDDWWPDVVPVAYLLPDTMSSIIFPIDFTSFVAWRLPSEFVRSGELLPFEGPSGSTFKLRKVTRVRGCPHWTLLRTDPNFGEIGDILSQAMNRCRAK